MSSITYKALSVERLQDNTFARQIRRLSTDSLPKGEILIRVHYSSLNYKDALSATGNKGVTRNYPHTPGIDAAGIVKESRVEAISAGDPVIVTSYDLGMNTPGGFGQYIRVPAEWVVKLPEGLTLKQSMILGTAGFTAGMSINRITKTIAPEQGSILVTGATGGVGSMACAILSHLGYDVTCVTGKKDTRLLRKLGVQTILTRADFLADTDAPMLKARWAGAIDTVGGGILAAAIKSTGLNGIVTCCGNVASPDLPINVFPFILRGISLLGIDSQHCPMKQRVAIWKKLAGEWKFSQLEATANMIQLEQIDKNIAAILKGRLQGRTIIDLE